MRRRLLVLIGLLVVLVAAPASAAPPARVLTMDAEPLLGANTPTADGWFTITVRLGNLTEAQVEGNVEVTSELKWIRDDARTTTRAPFAIPGKGAVTIQLPTHGWFDSGGDVTVRAVSAGGDVLEVFELPAPGSAGPLLFDLNTPSRIASFVRGAGVPVEYQPTSRSLYSFPTLSVGTAGVVAKTGDLALPDRAAGYSSVTTVLAKSEQIARITGAELEALGNWVLGGGSLAVVISRPEDLRNPTLTAMIGGQPTETAAPEALSRRSTFRTVPRRSPSSPSYGGRGATSQVRMEPEAETEKALVGYTGGNLRKSPWGASASYGLGEVHLLAFDATKAPFVDDRWVQLKMIDLVRHSWERRSHIILPHGASALDRPSVAEVRKVLDPNEGTRWAIAVAAILLLAYAVFAGPVNFVRAARAHRPLRALVHLPIWAGSTMAVIVGLGIVSKGVSGRSRHLTVIEAGAGMGKASVTRFRGFYASSADELTVHASHRGNVLDVAGETDDTGRNVVVDRDGARLERMQAKPWQTVVVREDGFTSLGAGVSIVQDGGGTQVVNRTARDLVSVVVKIPGDDARFFPKIGDGETVVVGKGKALSKRIGERTYGPRDLLPLNVEEFERELDDNQTRGSDGWRALEHLVYGYADWWPDDVPVLIGQVDGGEGKDSDSGLRLDRDHVLLRVIGYGGLK